LVRLLTQKGGGARFERVDLGNDAAHGVAVERVLQHEEALFIVRLRLRRGYAPERALVVNPGKALVPFVR
jgi:hypothetical protein